MPLCVVHVSMSPCLPVCAYVAILLVSVHVGILSWRSNNPDPPSHDVVFFSQFADAGICASLVVPVRPPADATPAAVCGTMALSAVPRIPCLQVPMSMSWAFFLCASVILPLSTEAGGDSHTELQPKKGPHAPHSPNPSRVRVLITVLAGPWRTMAFSTTMLTCFFDTAHHSFYTICMFTAHPVFVFHAHSTYRLCASCTLGSLRAWQSPTA
jgi:hypothetical protein